MAASLGAHVIGTLALEGTHMQNADSDRTTRRREDISMTESIAHNCLPFMMVAIVIPERDVTLMMSHAGIDASAPDSIRKLPTKYRNVSVITPGMRIDDCISIDTGQHMSIPRNRAFCVYMPPFQRDACGMPAYTAPAAMLEFLRMDTGLSERESHATERDIVQLVTRLDFEID